VAHPRTSETGVRLIINTSLTSPQVKAFIMDAHIWVEANLVGKCDALTDEILEAVEKYLTAHFISVREPQVTSLKHDDISESYSKQDYLGLAASLDPCGVIEDTLGETGKSRAKFRFGAGFDADLDLPVTQE